MVSEADGVGPNSDGMMSTAVRGGDVVAEVARVRSPPPSYYESMMSSTGGTSSGGASGHASSDDYKCEETTEFF